MTFELSFIFFSSTYYLLNYCQNQSPPILPSVRSLVKPINVLRRGGGGTRTHVQITFNNISTN